MNYKPLIKVKIDEATKILTEYSFGQILYSILREKNIGKKINKISDLISLKDEDILTAVERMIKEEIEEK